MKTKIALLTGLLVWGASAASWCKPEPFAGAAQKERPASVPLQPALECDDNYLRGDFNREYNRDREDVTILLNCLFFNPHSPYCLMCVADMNCDERLTQADASILILLVGLNSITQIVCSPPPPTGGM